MIKDSLAVFLLLFAMESSYAFSKVICLDRAEIDVYERNEIKKLSFEVKSSKNITVQIEFKDKKEMNRSLKMRRRGPASRGEKKFILGPVFRSFGISKINIMGRFGIVYYNGEKNRLRCSYQ